MLKLLFVLFPAFVFAVTPEPLPGWVHATQFSGDTTAKHGVFLNAPSSGASSAVAADLDGNLANGLEVVTVSANASVSAISSTGVVLWQHDLPSKGCGTTDMVYAAPSVGNILGDGVPYVVVGYGGLRTKACGGGVVALRGSNGSKLWDFDLKKFAKKNKFFAISHAVYGSPTLADTNGDGRLEVGFGALDRNVYLLNHLGKIIWYYNAADTVFSSPVFANIDSDPQLEMIIGTDISGNKHLKPVTNDGGILYALRTERGSKRRFYFRDPALIQWSVAFDQVIQSSPVIAEVLASSAGKEIVVGTGCYFPERNNDKRGKWLKVVRASDGKVLQTLNTSACLSSTAAIGDLDGDGVNEIVATVNGSKNVGGTGAGELVAFKAESSEPIWKTVPRSLGQNDTYLGTIQSPVLADLDGNGSLEVIISNASAVGIYSGATGVALTCEQRSCASNPILFTISTVKSTPLVADINLDGRLDLLVAGSHRSARKATVYAWTNFAEVLNSEPGALPPYALPWGQYKKNSFRNSVAD